jgi:hypothetical protein
LALSNAYLDLRKRQRKTNKEFVVWVMKPDNELMNYAPHNNGSGGCMRNSAICTWLLDKEENGMRCKGFV